VPKAKTKKDIDKSLTSASLHRQSDQYERKSKTLGKQSNAISVRAKGRGHRPDKVSKRGKKASTKNRNKSSERDT